ncbi:Acetyltransferase (GNAT) domain-containing protein [Amycolatopsis lurida]|uniref:Acetyltransferase n=1 Tax=Amycolatopsis lurida NRRL 2430 TaxID=1460371 RepID=A0A2P2FGJ4_AMYLU|nr:GNAT family N-acetyltransferase [Amycolatopsis lurida]KFU75847.1 acetyltransferase [Amycolatopsis lurida NRRL 2430]SEE33441.1 Acetyltransferase (GNAT) domain-containing protein [Amycolatopsis lurida]
MDDSYRLEAGSPSVDDYLRLRREAGLSEPAREQAVRGVDGAWASVKVIHRPTGEIVGMGRVISDGGWYFHIVDMAVLPAHQRRGIGDAVLDALLAEIDAAAPGAYVNLLGDPPGWRLYQRHGFVETAPGTIGMRRALETKS